MGLDGHWGECLAPAIPNAFRVVHAVQSIAPDKGRHHDDQTQSNLSWIEKSLKKRSELALTFLLRLPISASTPILFARSICNAALRAANKKLQINNKSFTQHDGAY